MMRIFEIFLMAIVLINQFAFYAPGGKPRSLFLGFILIIAVLFVLHFVTEGLRWQMTPLYLIVGVVILINIYLFFNAAYKPLYFLFFLNAVILAISLSATAGIVWPVFKIPTPTGPYLVGSSFLHFVDKNRDETLTNDPSDHREILVQAWYPSNVYEGATFQKLFNKNYLREWAIFTKRPEILYSHWNLIKGNAIKDGPVSDARSSYPVLIFSHGFLSDISCNVIQMEELASHGYIVFSVGHPYESAGLTFPDGRTASIIGPDGQLLQHIKNIFKEWTRQDRMIKLAMSSRDKNEQLRLMREYISNSPETDKSLKRWVEDVSFTVDQLVLIQDGSMENRFTGKLNLDQLGIFGFSFGGSCAAQSCVSDDRFKAAVNIDCVPQYGNLLDNPIRKPVMMMYSDVPKAGANDIIYEKTSSDYYSLILEGSRHNDMTVLSLSGPYFEMVKEAGPIRGKSAMEIINAYLLNFFDLYLKGTPSRLLEGPAYFKEVKDYRKLINVYEDTDKAGL